MNEFLTNVVAATCGYILGAILVGMFFSLTQENDNE